MTDPQLRLILGAIIVAFLIWNLFNSLSERRRTQLELADHKTRQAEANAARSSDDLAAVRLAERARAELIELGKLRERDTRSSLNTVVRRFKAGDGGIPQQPDGDGH